MPSTYIPFTEDQKERARTTDLVSLLRSQGETLKRTGKEYEWRDGSEKVTIRGNLWFHQYDREGGDAIDFVRMMPIFSSLASLNLPSQSVSEYSRKTAPVR